MNSAYSIVPSLLFLFLPSQSQQASKAGATTTGEAAAVAATKQNMFKFIEVDGNAFITKVLKFVAKFHYLLSFKYSKSTYPQI